MPVSIGETLRDSGQWEMTEQPVERGKRHCDSCSCDEINHVCYITVQTEGSAQTGAKRGNACGENKDKCITQINKLFLLKAAYLVFWFFCPAGSLLSTVLGGQGRRVFTPNGPTG